MNAIRFRILYSFGLILPTLVFGQEFRATLSGTEVDSSKAAIPTAVVQVTNTALETCPNLGEHVSRKSVSI